MIGQSAVPDPSVPPANFWVIAKRRREAGIALLALLLIIAGLGIGLAAVGTFWQTWAQREKEAELLFIGEQYRRALLSYARATPPEMPRMPRALDDLLLDQRQGPVPVRHLRRLYADPFSGKADWGLVRDAEGGIVGIFSQSMQKPLKTANFPDALKAFAHAPSYRQWVFSVGEAVPVARAAAASAGDRGAVPSRAIAAGEAASAGDGPARADEVADRARLELITSCQKGMERDYQACSSAAQGDGGRLHACLDEMTRRHRACLAGS